MKTETAIHKLRPGSSWSLPNGSILAADIIWHDNTPPITQTELDPLLAAPEPIPIPQQVPMWAVRTVLQNDGLFDQAQVLITASTDNALKNVWEYGNFADRNSAAIATLSAALDLTSDQVDQMFIDANSLSV